VIERPHQARPRLVVGRRLLQGEGEDLELVAIVNFLPNKERSESKTQVSGLFVPKSAVQELGDTSTVWRIDSDKTIHRVKVLTTPKSDDLLKVEDGLKAGDRVVLNPGPEMSENLKVSLPD